MLFSAGLATADERPLIILYAGEKKDEGRDAHNYDMEVELLKQALEGSLNAPRVRINVVRGPWPGDKVMDEALAEATCLLLTGDGAWKGHPLYVDGKGKQLAQPRLPIIEKHLTRGMGLVVTHAILDNCRYKTSREPGLEAYGHVGWWLQQTGGVFLGDMPHVTCVSTAVPLDAEHPVMRGVGSITTREEYYHGVYFAPEDDRVTPLLGAKIPADKHPDKMYTLAWATRREDGGRSFAFTGPHFIANYAIPDERRMVAQAILWCAKTEVPADGLQLAAVEGLRPPKQYVPNE